MVDSTEKLADFLKILDAAEWIAVDTEADSLHAYPEKLCLIQISIAEGDFLVDPLSGIDLTGFWQVLSRHELILHGADYDLRLLNKNHRFVPSRIFDTMLAARLIGLTEFGLTHLVERFLGVKLEKGSQKADWARRPLTPKMEEYARNDTRYLKRLSDLLREQLVAKRRLEWHQQSCEQLITDATHLPAPDPDAWRVKGSHILGPPALAVLRELWRWREEEAVASNRPPFFILKHESLVILAVAAVSGEDLGPRLPRNFSPAKMRGVKEAVQRGLALPSSQMPGMPVQNHRRVPVHKQRFQQWQGLRDQMARELEIDPTLIASRAVLIGLAEDYEQTDRQLMPWQRNLLRK